MSRTRLIFDALWPTLLMWLVLVVIAVWKDASLPSDRDGWAQFAVLCLVIEFLAALAGVVWAARRNNPLGVLRQPRACADLGHLGTRQRAAARPARH
jgi:hypothetical protein